MATVDVGAPVHQVVPDPENLAGRVEQAFDNPALGARCRDYFERNHAPSQVLARYTEVFASL